MTLTILWLIQEEAAAASPADSRAGSQEVGAINSTMDLNSVAAEGDNISSLALEGLGRGVEELDRVRLGWVRDLDVMGLFRCASHGRG